MPEKVVDLEAILKKHFGCKSPFLKNPVVVDQGIEWKHYRYISRNGDKAYAKLVELIYDLEKLLPDLIDSNEIVEQLDQIVDGDSPY